MFFYLIIYLFFHFLINSNVKIDLFIYLFRNLDRVVFIYLTGVFVLFFQLFIVPWPLL